MLLKAAQRISESIIRRFAPNGGGFVAGSTRRMKAAPRDIEILLPLPADGSQVDPVYEAMQNYVIVPDAGIGLFAGPAVTDPTWKFTAVKGFKPGFGFCQLELDPIHLKGWPRSMGRFNVDIFRYMPGEQGNFGWAMLMRTGHAEFSQAALVAWKRRQGTKGTQSPGSVDGFLVDGDGLVVPTPTEDRCFEIMGIEWVEPQMRDGAAQVRPVNPTISRT